jgi:large subunit ribosomal protein L30
MEKKAENNTASKENIAAIRIRGPIHVNGKVEDTMHMLKLYKVNFCTILPKSKMNANMLSKAKDYITWGEIDEPTLNELKAKREQKTGEKPKKFFRLNSPKKGYGRKGIKYTFTSGGALGYRGQAINDLIKRMI